MRILDCFIRLVTIEAAFNLMVERDFEGTDAAPFGAELYACRIEFDLAIWLLANP